jgi:hypothetical protein
MKRDTSSAAKYLEAASSLDSKINIIILFIEDIDFYRKKKTADTILHLFKILFCF